MPDSFNILIADHDSAAAAAIREMCGTIPGVAVTGVAHSKRMLIVKTRNSNPDLILLDLSGPMGGAGVVDIIKKEDPDLNIIVLYPPDTPDSDSLIHALELGVYECIEKPGKDSPRLYTELRLQLLTITGLLRSRKRFSRRAKPQYKSKFFMPAGQVEKAVRQTPADSKAAVVVIASSTGGPEILSRIFSILPGDLKVPVLLVQHIPESITRYFAKSLNEKSELEICLAEQGDIVQPSKVYLAPGGRHMTVSRPDAKGRRSISLTSDGPVNSVRPSADLLFESIARSYQGNVLAIVLTGMGEDGKNGVAALKEKGCHCITQTAETCVVYGMPRAVDEAGLSDECMDPLSITQKIVMMTR